jgi:hypothetical protein
LLDEARRELEKFKWINHKKIPEYRKESTDAGSPELNEAKAKLTTFLKKEDYYIKAQELYLSMLDMRADELLVSLKSERPKTWSDLEQKIPTLDVQRENKIFDLEMKYKAQPKSWDYYNEALHLEFVNKKKIIQILDKKEEYIHDFMVALHKSGVKIPEDYMNHRGEHKLAMSNVIRDIRANKREVEEFIKSKSNLENPPVSTGSGSGPVSSSGSNSGPAPNPGAGSGPGDVPPSDSGAGPSAFYHGWSESFDYDTVGKYLLSHQEHADMWEKTLILFSEDSEREKYENSYTISSLEKSKVIYSEFTLDDLFINLEIWLEDTFDTNVLEELFHFICKL